MWQKFKNLVHDDIGKALTVPAIIGSLNFLVNILESLSDGKIDGTEFHGLLASSNALQTLILFAVVFILKLKK